MFRKYPMKTSTNKRITLILVTETSLKNIFDTKCQRKPTGNYDASMTRVEWLPSIKLLLC